MGIRSAFIIAVALAVVTVLCTSPASALVEGPPLEYGNQYGQTAGSPPQAMNSWPQALRKISWNSLFREIS